MNPEIEKLKAEIEEHKKKIYSLEVENQKLRGAGRNAKTLFTEFKHSLGPSNWRGEWDSIYKNFMETF